MEKNLLIIGMGPGLSLGVAEKFGKEGFKVGMVSRNAEKLQGFQNQLTQLGIESAFAVADVGNTAEMLQALAHLQKALGPVTVLLYNAVDYRMSHLLSETADSLTEGFRISVANAFEASKFLLPDLKAHQGTILFTGGASGSHPSPDMASISLGKAGIRNLALQLHQVLQAENVFVGTLTISGWIQPDSTTHSPKILAEKFWELHTHRNQVEIIY